MEPRPRIKSSATAATAERHRQAREDILAFYAKHNPEKVAGAPALIDKYKALGVHEPELLDTIVKKYTRKMTDKQGQRGAEDGAVDLSKLTLVRTLEGHSKEVRRAASTVLLCCCHVFVVGQVRCHISGRAARRFL